MERSVFVAMVVFKDMVNLTIVLWPAKEILVKTVVGFGLLLCIKLEASSG